MGTRGFGPSGPRLSRSKFDRPRDAYSATDIQAIILGKDQTTKKTVVKLLGEIQTLSYSIHREKTPIRTIGRTSPPGYTAGTRTIAGSLIFATFNARALTELYSPPKSTANTEGLGNSVLTTGNIDGRQELLSDAKLVRSSDTIPPFDILLYFSSETGNDSVMSLHRVDIMDEGQTFSIQDIYTEHTMQFVAAEVSMMEKVKDKWQTGVTASAEVFRNVGLIRRSTAQGFTGLA